MYPSAEVRWFSQGVVRPAVLEWFGRSEPAPEEEPTRVDYYLRGVGGSMSVKLREGRVEVKQRHQEGAMVRFHERVAGRVELWRKWSFGLIRPVGQPWSPETMGPHWIVVEKRRSLVRHRLDGERVVAAGPAAIPDQGCDLELTRVRVGREEWWSVGLEAYGPEANLENTLLLVAGYLMTRTEPPSLAAGHSYGYPAWLLRLEQEPDRLLGSAELPGR